MRPIHALLAAALVLGGMAPAALADPVGESAARLSANVTAVVLVTEVLFASVSAVLLGAGQLSLPLLAGGSLIVGAALLSVLER